MKRVPNAAMFLTPMLLLRGCPEDKVDEACEWLGELTLPYTASNYIKQIDEAIHGVQNNVPRPSHEHQWSAWYKDRGFFALDRQEARECLKCGTKEHRDGSH